MSSYVDIIKKEIKVRLEAYFDDRKANTDPHFFGPTGTQVYIGKQGGGKTISAVKHLHDIKRRWPLAVIVSNLDLKYFEPIDFTSKADLMRKLNAGIYPQKQYIRFSSMEQLAIVLTKINNGRKGVIYLIDEIHTYFNALDSKNIPPYIFTEISQQRKQRKCIVGTSQLFTRMAKPFREQCDNMIKCFTWFGFITFQIAFDGMSVTQDYDGGLHGSKRKMGWFFHTRYLRNAFDTFQKVVSGDVQYEAMQEPEKPKKLFSKKDKKGSGGA